MDFELTEEQKMLKETVARFVDRDIIPLAAEIDEEERFPEENFKAMVEMGLFGMPIPEAYGGCGTDFFSCILVMEEIMRGCVSTDAMPPLRYARQTGPPSSPGAHRLYME